MDMELTRLWKKGRNDEDTMEKEESNMKTLYAKKAVVIGLRFSALIDMALALCAVLSFIAEEMGSVVFYIILMIFYGYVGVYKGIKIYRTHWIKYGDGKVIIKRISKDRVNGRPTGKWQTREDEFLLEEIDFYGISWQVLGEFVEYHLSRRGAVSECFFQLKNGKRIGCEILYFDFEEEEIFFRYLFENTGIGFQGKLEKWK